MIIEWMGVQSTGKWSTAKAFMGGVVKLQLRDTGIRAASSPMWCPSLLGLENMGVWREARNYS